MKKGDWLLCISLIMLLGFLIFAVQPVLAQVGSLDEIHDTISNLPDNPQDLVDSSKDALQNKIEQSFNDFISNNTVMKAISSWYLKHANTIDPIFVFSVGLKPTMTWLFVLGLVLWFSCFIWFYRISSFLEVIAGYLRIVVTLVIMAFISLTGLCRILSGFILKIFGLIDTWWLRVAAIILFVLGLIVLDIFSSQISRYFRREKDKKETRATRKTANRAARGLEEMKKKRSEESAATETKSSEVSEKKNKYGLSPEEEEEVEEEAEETVEGLGED